MDSYMYNQRPGFKFGIGKPINIKNVSYIPPQKLQSGLINMRRNLGYKEEAPKSRLYGIKSTDDLTNEILKKDGIKVYLSDSTITNLLQSKVPKTITTINPDGTKNVQVVKDKFGRPIMIDSKVNLSLLMKMLNNSEVELNNLNVKVRQTTADLKNKDTKLAFLQTLLEELVKKAGESKSDTIPKTKLISIARANRILSKPVNPLPTNSIKLSKLKSDIKTRDISYGQVLLYLISEASSRNLTEDSPIYGVRGEPITIQTFDKYLRKEIKEDGDYILDMETSRFFKDSESYYAFIGSPLWNEILKQNGKRDKIDDLVTLSYDKIVQAVKSDLKKGVKDPVTDKKTDTRLLMSKIIESVVKILPIDEKTEKKLYNYLEDKVLELSNIILSFVKKDIGIREGDTEEDDEEYDEEYEEEEEKKDLDPYNPVELLRQYIIKTYPDDYREIMKLKNTPENKKNVISFFNNRSIFNDFNDTLDYGIGFRNYKDLYTELVNKIFTTGSGIKNNTFRNINTIRRNERIKAKNEMDKYRTIKVNQKFTDL